MLNAKQNITKLSKKINESVAVYSNGSATLLNIRSEI
jgi:hypothetical protein